ncbi:MAG: hypothetical protein ABIC95_04820 [archaeon]
MVFNFLKKGKKEDSFAGEPQLDVPPPPPDSVLMDSSSHPSTPSPTDYMSDVEEHFPEPPKSENTDYDISLPPLGEEGIPMDEPQTPALAPVAEPAPEPMLDPAPPVEFQEPVMKHEPEPMPEEPEPSASEPPMPMPMPEPTPQAEPMAEASEPYHEEPEHDFSKPLYLQLDKLNKAHDQVDELKTTIKRGNDAISSATLTNHDLHGTYDKLQKAVELSLKKTVSLNKQLPAAR